MPVTPSTRAEWPVLAGAETDSSPDRARKFGIFIEVDLASPRAPAGTLVGGSGVGRRTRLNPRMGGTAGAAVRATAAADTTTHATTACDHRRIAIPAARSSRLERCARGARIPCEHRHLDVLIAAACCSSAAVPLAASSRQI